MKKNRQLHLLLLFSLAGAFLLPGEVAEARKKKNEPQTAEDLQVVACLLPGQVRRLGQRTTYVTARRPVRTTAIDCRIRGGEYVESDRASYAAALQVWLPAAEAGDARAQTYVGEIFEKGLAGTPDYQVSAIWYQKAAEAGDVRAQINLGHLYELGLGVEQDHEVALQWYRRSAGLEEAVVLDWTVQEAELRRETKSLRQELDAVRSELAQARSRLGDAEREVERLRKRLEEARRQGAEESQELADELQQREANLAEIRSTVDRYKDRLAQLTAIEVAGPSITIVEPEVLGTRGPILVPVPAGARELAITGRVTAPAGLSKLTVDGVAREVDDNGFFTVTVACRGRTEVSVEAEDRRGRTAEAALVIEPGGDASAPAPVAAPRLATRSAVTVSPDHYALVISVAAYENLQPLRTAAADGRAIARLLEERYGYRTTLLADPTHFEILNALNGLRETLDEDDHLLVYYAGHGKVSNGRGYWIGVDGAADDPARWIPNEAVSDMLDVIAARHVLVVSDSCYSGTLTRSGMARVDVEASGEERAARLAEIAGKRSRTVLTSGGLRPVLDEGGGDHSIFAQAFLRVLELNGDDMPGADLHREVEARVRFRARALGLRQQPGYAPIRHAGHEAGDFVLVPRG